MNEYKILDKTNEKTSEEIKEVFKSALKKMPRQFSSNELHEELEDFLKKCDENVVRKNYPAFISHYVKSGKLKRTGKFVNAKYGLRRGNRFIPVYEKGVL